MTLTSTIIDSQLGKLKETVFDFSENAKENENSKQKLKFLEILDVQTLSHSECRLWALQWKAAIAAAQFLFSSKFNLKGLNILEIGAGSGFVGCSVGMLNGQIRMTDRVDSAVQLAQLNIDYNQISSIAKSSVMDWNKIESQDLPESPYDIILGSDVLYQARNVTPIIEIVKNHLINGGYALFFCPGRGYAEKLYEAASKESGLESRLHLFFQVQLLFCNMPELHCVEIQKASTSNPQIQTFIDQFQIFAQKLTPF